MSLERKFNKNAYLDCDLKCKNVLYDIMINKGYVIVGDINNETFKKHDAEFYHPEKNIILKFENEMRMNFYSIKNRLSSIHVPIRKKNTLANYYIVWNSDCNEFAIFDTKLLKESPLEKNVKCHQNKNISEYKEDFIAISKKNVSYYKLIDNRWKKV